MFYQSLLHLNVLPIRRRKVTHVGALFRKIRCLLTLDFSFIFEVTSDSELYALWRRKSAQKDVFGKPFRSDFQVSGESENEAPVQTPAPFSRFQGAKKATDFALFPEGV